MTERGNNIVIIYADCTPEADAEYNRWYDTRHMPQRLTVPGYLATVRYQNTGKGAKYVMLYELSGADVLDSAPVKQISATYGDALAAVAKTGETTSDTLARLSTDITGVNSVFGALGYQLYDVSVAGAATASRSWRMSASSDAGGLAAPPQVRSGASGCA